MKLAIFDARSLFDRAWYASRRNTDLVEEYGSRTCAADAAAVMLSNLLGPGGRLPFEPDHVVFCWDGKPKTNKPRPPKPPGFVEDKEWFFQALPDWVGGAHQVHHEGESDDLVASLVWTYRDLDDLVVVSSDKDLHQVVGDGPKVRYYDLHKRETLSREAMFQRWPVKRLSHVAAYLAIVGDHSDGVDGVPGLGPKKTQALLAGLPDMPLGDLFEHLAARLGDPFVEAFNATCLNRCLPVVAPAPVRLNPEPDPALSPDGVRAWRRLLNRCTHLAGDQPAEVGCFEDDEV